MERNLISFRLLVVALFIMGLVLPQRGDAKFSVAEWEKLVSVILMANSVSNVPALDVNEDGQIDVKDLCGLVSRFTEENKNSGKKHLRVLEAILSKGTTETEVYKNRMEWEKDSTCPVLVTSSLYFGEFKIFKNWADNAQFTSSSMEIILPLRI